MFEFQAPEFLWLLVFLPFLAVKAFRGLHARRASVQFSSVGLLQSIPKSAFVGMRRLLPVLRLLAIALFIVALARPRFGTTEREITQEGVDIFYCIDISQSMSAVDFKPNRLEKAKELTAQFIGQRQNNRQGIVLFAGESFMLCPLSFDGATVQEFLKRVDFDDVGVPGTAIGMGLSRALKKMLDSKAKSKVVILLTDGESNVGTIKPRQAMRVAKKMGVRVYTIGIGSKGWVDVPVRTNRGTVYQRVRTEIDEVLLQEMADETGGRYYRAQNAKELEGVFEQIDALEKTEIEMQEFRTYDERMAMVCWPALLLLLIEIILGGTRFLKIP